MPSNITPLHPRRVPPRRPVLITLNGNIVPPACRVIDLARIAGYCAEKTGKRTRLRCSGWSWASKPREQERSE